MKKDTIYQSIERMYQAIYAIESKGEHTAPVNLASQFIKTYYKDASIQQQCILLSDMMPGMLNMSMTAEHKNSLEASAHCLSLALSGIAYFDALASHAVFTTVMPESAQYTAPEARLHVLTSGNALKEKITEADKKLQDQNVQPDYIALFEDLAKHALDVMAYYAQHEKQIFQSFLQGLEAISGTTPTSKTVIKKGLNLQ